MARLISTLMLIFASALAGAHSLPGDTSVVHQAEHVMSSPHHVLPLILLLGVLGILVAVTKTGGKRKSR